MRVESSATTGSSRRTRPCGGSPRRTHPAETVHTRGRLPTPSGRSCGRGEIADRSPAPPTSVNAGAVYRDRKKLFAPDIANQDFSEARALELLLELQID